MKLLSMDFTVHGLQFYRDGYFPSYRNTRNYFNPNTWRGAQGGFRTFYIRSPKGEQSLPEGVVKRELFVSGINPPKGFEFDPVERDQWAQKLKAIVSGPEGKPYRVEVDPDGRVKRFAQPEIGVGLRKSKADEIDWLDQDSMPRYSIPHFPNKPWYGNGSATISIHLETTMSDTEAGEVFTAKQVADCVLHEVQHAAEQTREKVIESVIPNVLDWARQNPTVTIGAADLNRMLETVTELPSKEEWSEGMRHIGDAFWRTIEGELYRAKHSASQDDDFPFVVGKDCSTTLNMSLPPDVADWSFTEVENAYDNSHWGRWRNQKELEIGAKDFGEFKALIEEHRAKIAESPNGTTNFSRVHKFMSAWKKFAEENRDFFSMWVKKMPLPESEELQLKRRLARTHSVSSTPVSDDYGLKFFPQQVPAEVTLSAVSIKDPIAVAIYDAIMNYDGDELLARSFKAAKVFYHLRGHHDGWVGISIFADATDDLMVRLYVNVHEEICMGRFRYAAKVHSIEPYDPMYRVVGEPLSKAERKERALRISNSHDVKVGESVRQLTEEDLTALGAHEIPVGTCVNEISSSDPLCISLFNAISSGTKEDTLNCIFKAAEAMQEKYGHNQGWTGLLVNPGSNLLGRFFVNLQSEVCIGQYIYGSKTYYVNPKAVEDKDMIEVPNPSGVEYRLRKIGDKAASLVTYTQGVEAFAKLYHVYDGDAQDGDDLGSQLYNLLSRTSADCSPALLNEVAAMVKKISNGIIADKGGVMHPHAIVLTDDRKLPIAVCSVHGELCTIRYVKASAGPTIEIYPVTVENQADAYRGLIEGLAEMMSLWKMLEDEHVKNGRRGSYILQAPEGTHPNIQDLRIALQKCIRALEGHFDQIGSDELMVKLIQAPTAEAVKAYSIASVKANVLDGILRQWEECEAGLDHAFKAPIIALHETIKNAAQMFKESNND